MTHVDDWQRLAEHVRVRRGDLGLTQEEVAAAGGPSTATLRLIEGARQAGYRPRILRELERALRWERGSCRGILAGGNPTPVSEDDTTLPGVTPAPAPVAATRDPAATRAGLALAAEMHAIAAEVHAEIDEERAAGTPEDRIFDDPAEQALWAIPLMAEHDRVLRIAALRSMRPPAAPRNTTTTTSPPAELAG